VEIAIEDVDYEPAPSGMWWLFLITGILWVLISFVILTVDPTSAALIGWMTGFVILLAGINEFVQIGFVQGWKWLHAVLGVLFLITGIFAFIEPFQTFGILALLIGWYLLFKGTFEVIYSIAERHWLPLWGLLLAGGIIQILIGLWAIGYPGRSAALLILWVGVGAMMRGITEIFLAFQLRGGGGRPAYA
jgi:uncharacterized membrane protein HdeD (DUF308 family)